MPSPSSCSAIDHSVSPAFTSWVLVGVDVESAAAAGLAIEGGNRYRTESNDEAVAIDRRLRVLWSPHPGFHLVPHSQSFLRKITVGLSILESLVANHRGVA